MTEPTFREIQMWAWRRDNRRYPLVSTVAEAAKRFKVTVEKIVEIVGHTGPYFYIVGDGPEAIFEHDGD